MDRRTPLVTLFLVALLGAAFLSGCTRVVTSGGAGADLENTVTASGNGMVSASPDQAEMSFGVTAQHANAKTALDNASAAAEKIIAAVKGAGVDDKDIQTQNVSVFPISTESGGRTRITGYRASLSVRAKVRDLGSLGEVINAASNAGADTIDGPSFTIDDDSSFRDDAIADAVTDARRSAEAMAKAADKTVGDVVRISATDVNVPFFGAERSAGLGAADQAVPIEPGQLDVTANVTVVFELR